MKTELSPIERQALKARAHTLSPTVIIGDKGLTAPVLREIDRSLKAHELVKIRATGEDRAQRDAWLAEICNALAAAPVQHIGKILIVYRESPELAKARQRTAAPRPTPKAPRLTRQQEEMIASGQMRRRRPPTEK